MGQLGFVAAPDHVDVEREIAGPERDAPDPGAGGEDRVEPVETRAVSMIGIRSMPPGARPRSRSSCASSQSTVASPAALSTFGRMMPSSPGRTTATQIAIAELGIDRIDPDIKQAGAAVARTQPRTASRAAGFSAIATASSRSRITASASSDSAFSTRRA